MDIIDNIVSKREEITELLSKVQQAFDTFVPHKNSKIIRMVFTNFYTSKHELEIVAIGRYKKTYFFSRKVEWIPVIYTIQSEKLTYGSSEITKTLARFRIEDFLGYLDTYCHWATFLKENKDLLKYIQGAINGDFPTQGKFDKDVIIPEGIF